MAKSRVAQLSDQLCQRFPPGRQYLAGVSGGRDSVILLHLLHASGYRNLVVCHLDHQLRGRASQADARFVQAMATKLGFDHEIGSIDVRALAARSKLSIETAARAARFAFFVDVARRRRCRTIFLGHHADDLVETALLNLFRGASPGGLASMRTVSSHQIGKTELTIVRPLLGVWRREIDAYVKQHNLKFREDATNAKLDSMRNRVRHRILPEIEKQLGRDVRKAIWRATQIWMEEEALLESLADKNSASTRELNVLDLRKRSVALQRRIIRRWLINQRVSNSGFELVEKIRALLDPQYKAAKVNLPQARYVRRRAKKIFME
ncbi:MAG: tRNA(Ile)-lysidine synthase [Verrucomicrobiota bacterium]